MILKLVKPIIEKYPKLAMMYRYIRDSQQILATPKETTMGFRFTGNISMEKGEFEPDETYIIKKLLPGVDVFINVGANIGYYCCIALLFNKYTVAFEPITQNLRYLYKNIKANGWQKRFEVFPLALSNNIDIIEIYGGGTGASLIKGWAGTSDQYATLVPSSTLDYVLGDKFRGKRALILVDIEGAEKKMLEGASNFLNRQPKPIWIVEISVLEHQPKGIKVNPDILSTFAIFWNNGYEAWTTDKSPRLVKHDEVERIVISGSDTLLNHNFLFIDKGKKAEILGS